METNISIDVPQGTYGRIAPRSGLALKHGINTGASVIDADYTGPIGILSFNHGNQDFQIQEGDRIAQLILKQIANKPVMAVWELTHTQRGNKGFGSTGSQQINIISGRKGNNINTSNSPSCTQDTLEGMGRMVNRMSTKSHLPGYRINVTEGLPEDIMFHLHPMLTKSPLHHLLSHYQTILLLQS